MVNTVTSPTRCSCYTPWNVRIHRVTWKRGIKIADGITVANQLTWKWRGYSRLSWIMHVGPMLSQVSFKVEEGILGNRESQDNTLQRFDWHAGLKMEGVLELRHVASC